jgi:type I restriction enzyme M protein
MPLKKSELYSSLWASCDELRGGMDASQYKDYVLALLFVKYVSDKYAGEKYGQIVVPEGARFADMVSLKGKKDIGDQINKKIIAPIVKANSQLSRSDFPDFYDAVKLGGGKEMTDRLTNLVAIFESPALDFSKNRAEGDDLLGDAYEYLMRNFATESGKSKGQFYTPAEVSRVIARLLDIRHAKTTNKTTVYDPTCGSGSLLIKVAAEASHDKDVKVTLYGQEKDSATAGLARMNMILHDDAGAMIGQGNTLANPLYKDGEALKTFDFVVANPPFSDKRWSNGLHPDEGGKSITTGEQTAKNYGRFEGFGIPPGKQGDYAYLLHILRSIKPGGKGACILPHGVLFRGNSEGAIRKNLILRGYIKGIIGLPANLFYGTGIPACIIILDKENAAARKGIFMIDASKGFMKDGPKNRLREQDIHRIVDVFTRQVEVPRYSRMVPVSEISDPKNDFNLNLPRYIDSTEPEDLQDIDAHLRGGIPNRDIDALESYWKVIPGVRGALFTSADRPGYSQLKVPVSDIKPAIFRHPEFTAFKESVARLFARWKTANLPKMKSLSKKDKPKAFIETLSEGLLDAFAKAPLVDAYDMYQHLMDYWAETMQDDCYFIAVEGWKAETYRNIVRDKNGKEKDKGWVCDLVPKSLLVAHYFAKEQEETENIAAELETVTGKLTELEEENSGEEGVFSELEKINRASVSDKLKELRAESAQVEIPLKQVAESVVPFGEESGSEEEVLLAWLNLSNQEAELKKKLKEAEAELDAKALAKYPKLTVDEIKTLVVDEKWLAALTAAVQGELDRVSQVLTGRVRQLAERYATTLPKLADEVKELTERVNKHLKKMDPEWK